MMIVLLSTSCSAATLCIVCFIIFWIRQISSLLSFWIIFMQKEQMIIFFFIQEWILTSGNLFAGCYGKVWINRNTLISALPMYCFWISIYWYEITRNLCRCLFSTARLMCSVMRLFSISRIITEMWHFRLWQSVFIIPMNTLPV